MPYLIELTAEAEEDLKSFRKSDRVKILDAIAEHLTHEPAKHSKSRIKQLRLGTKPPYRLRIDDYRAYYDIFDDMQVVVIYGIVAKIHSSEWLLKFGSENLPEGD